MKLFISLLYVAEFGYYVPKAFYTIDENGQASPTVFVNVC